MNEYRNTFPFIKEERVEGVRVGILYSHTLSGSTPDTQPQIRPYYQRGELAGSPPIPSMPRSPAEGYSDVSKGQRRAEGLLEDQSAAWARTGWSQAR